MDRPVTNALEGGGVRKTSFDVRPILGLRDGESNIATLSLLRSSGSGVLTLWDLLSG